MPPPNILLTHPGTQYSHALAAQLHRLGMLQRFATGIGYGEDHRWGSRLAPARTITAVPEKSISRIALPEITALLLRKLRPGSEQAILRRRNEQFQRSLPERWIIEAGAVIGFDTSSWILAHRSKAFNKPFYLDCSIPHPLAKEAIYARLREEFPQWTEQLPAKPKWMLEQEAEEMKLASRIVAATSFTAGTLVKQGIATDKIRVNPYGTDLQFFHSKWEKGFLPTGETVQFVFMGKIGARKGIPWLLRVWQKLHKHYPNATLTIAGDGAWPSGFPIPEGVTTRGFVPAAERADFLRRFDVFVFPSYFEGFGQVILEAMACGLPIITTTHTAAPEIMTTASGFIITPGDDDALLNSLAHFADNPSAIQTMGKAARHQALPWSWDAYGDRWAGILGEGGG